MIVWISFKTFFVKKFKFDKLAVVVEGDAYDIEVEGLCCWGCYYILVFKVVLRSFFPICLELSWLVRLLLMNLFIRNSELIILELIPA